MPDFLLELRSEEIPARMQAGARAELEKLFRREMAAAGIEAGAVTAWSTPRRLALIARDLPGSTSAVSEEAKGPPEDAPDAAIDGFCRKNGVTRDQLELREVKGRNTWFAVIEKPGRATRDLLAEAIPAIVRDFAWPKSMRWGAASISTESPRWVRPLSGIVAILGEELVECEAAGVRSGYATHGHRFHCPGEITIGGAHDYAEKLRACHVIVDHEERAALIREGAAKAAAAAGLTLVDDEGLVVENAGLTEWPVPLLGRFDEAFLDVPPEVIQLTARTNQKYFVCTNPPLQGEGDRSPQASGGGVSPSTAGDTPPSAAAPPPPPLAGEDRLANAFVCTANIAAADGGAAIVDGNRKVLAARLADARFFWEQDRKTPLAEHAKKLERITFHEKLGTVADKVERVAKLARWLVEEGIVGSNPTRGAITPPTRGATTSVHPEPVEGRGEAPADRASTSSARAVEELADQAEQAARLCKADLVTEMVGEFPELQGLMGGYYARAEGLPDEVADAIRDHYKPVGQSDEVPTAPVTVAVSLADKLDTLASFFAIDEKPTGSKDPFALRRAALAILRIIRKNKLRLSLRDCIREAYWSLLQTASAGSIAVHIPEGSEAAMAWPQILPGETYRAAGRVGLIPNEQEDRHAGRQDGRVTFSEDIILDLQDENLGAFWLYGLTDVVGDLMVYFSDRLSEDQRRFGIKHDVVQAVIPREYFVIDLDRLFDDRPQRIKGEGVQRFSVRQWGTSDDPVEIVARVQSLQDFLSTEDGANLLAGYKRAANILKKEDWHGAEGEIAQTGEEDPLANVDDPDLAAVIDAKMADAHAKELSYTPEPAEKALMDALDSAEPAAARAIAAEDFSAAMAALASLRAPIDRFFDEVTVNADEENKRAHRLDLLARFRAAVHEVADFSRIEG